MICILISNFTDMKYLTLFCFLLMCSSCDQPRDAEVAKAQLESIDYDQKLKDLGIDLPPVSPPQANYVNITQSGNLLFLAGKGPRKVDGSYITGKIGDDLTQEQGYEAAKLVAINQIAVLKDHLGDLNKLKRILKVTGMVNATSDFTNQPEVINGFSDLMFEVFGDKGKHARAAVGMGSLPRGICVEIELIAETY